MKTLILPEEVIHRIQSFMNGRDAARSTVLSKSWHYAWLTRPTIDLEEDDFRFRGDFVEVATKTVQRYLDSNQKIEGFRLRSYNYCKRKDITDKLVADAIRAGATDVKLVAPDVYSSPYLPPELLASESLLRLSLIGFDVSEGSVVSCSRLKSLDWSSVTIRADRLDEIASSCCGSLEELSLSGFPCFESRLSEKLFELHKLRRMYLHRMDAPTQFFAGFASRFPCLKDLTIHKSIVPSILHISSNSLETITFKPCRNSTSYEATFDVPNIRRFTFSGIDLPPLSINGGSREWELDMTIRCNGLYNGAWFLKLKKVLKKCSLSRIASLNLKWVHNRRSDAINEREHDIEVGVGVEPLVVENLRIDAPSEVIYALLLRLFWICRPKFVTSRYQHSYAWLILRKRLIHVPISRNCGMPEQYVFGKFGLEKVISRNCGMPEQYVFGKFGLEKVIHEEFDDGEKHLVVPVQGNKRFILTWD